VSGRAPFLHHRLDSAEWDTIELYLMTRAGACCEVRSPRCAAGPHGELARLTRDRIAIHHRLARGAGGTTRVDAHSLSALLLVCESCHIHLETAERGHAYRRGWLVPHARPGHPTPATDPDQVPLVLYGGRRVLLHPESPEYLPPADGMAYDLTA
jgi:hypothetical protein